MREGQGCASRTRVFPSPQRGEGGRRSRPDEGSAKPRRRSRLFAARQRHLPVPPLIGLPATYNNTITGVMLIVIVVVDALTQRSAIENARRKRLLSRTGAEGGAKA